MNKLILASCWVLSMVVAAATGAQVQAQFIAPPPPVAMDRPQDGFNSHDREVLTSIHNKLSAVHAKLFPFDGDRRLLELH